MGVLIFNNNFMKKLILVVMFGLILAPLAKADTQVFGFMNGQFYDVQGTLKYACLMDGSCYDYTTTKMTTLSKILGLDSATPSTITVSQGLPTPTPTPQIVYLPAPTPSPTPTIFAGGEPAPTVTPTPVIYKDIASVSLDSSSPASQNMHSNSVNQIIGFFNVNLSAGTSYPRITELTFSASNMTSISVGGTKSSVANGVAIISIPEGFTGDFQLLADFSSTGSAQATLTGIKYVTDGSNKTLSINVSTNTFTLVP